MPTADTASPADPVARIGVFGGTFDPPHIGHLVSAIEVRDALGLDRVLMVVAGEPWQKVTTRDVTPGELRLEMVRAAVAEEAGLEASDIELRREGPSYTVDTLSELAEEHPGAELVLILGSDAAAGLGTWHRPDEVARRCRIAVVERPGVTTAVPGRFRVERVPAPRLEVSSSDLRDRAREGRSLRHLVPDAVVSLIREGDIYGGGR